MSETGYEAAGAAEAGERSLMQNIMDVFMAPSETFEDVGRRPKWLPPLLVVLAITSVVAFLQMPLYVEMQQLQLARMDPEQREQAESAMAAFKWVGFIVAPIATAIITAILAFVFYGWGAVTGAKNARYPVALAALAYAGFIVMLQSIAQTVVVLVKGAEQVAREGGPPMFGLSLFLEKGEMPGILWGLVQNLNFFSVWHTVVLAIAGVHALRMGKGSAWSYAIAMWVVGGLLLALQGMGQGG